MAIRKQTNDGTQRREIPLEDFKQELFDKNLVRVKGKLTIKDGEYDPITETALKTELRRRNTEAFVTKLSTEKAQLTKELELLKNAMANEYIPKNNSVVNEDLKYEDVDEYIKQQIALQTSLNPHEKTFTEAQHQAESEVKNQVVTDAVSEHNKAHPDRPITPELLAMDIDVDESLNVALQDGSISTTEYLDIVSEKIYSLRGADEKANIEEPNLSSVGATNTFVPDTVDYSSSLF